MTFKEIANENLSPVERSPKEVEIEMHKKVERKMSPDSPTPIKLKIANLLTKRHAITPAKFKYDEEFL